MTKYLYGLFQIIWYVILCKLFLEIFIKKNTVKRSIEFLLWIGLILGNYQISILFATEFLNKQILIILLTSIIMYWIFRQKYSTILILLLLYQAGCLVIEYMTLVILEKCIPSFTETMMSSSIAGSLVGILCQMIMFCMILFMRKYFTQNSFSSFTEVEWIRISIFPLFTIITIIALIMNFGMIQTPQQGNILVYIVCGLLIMNILIFCLINDVMKREQEISEYRLFQQKMKNQTDTYRNISEKYEKQRKQVHEFTNKMSCIMVLAQKGELEKLQKYLAGMQSDMIEQTDYIDTNNILINAILNSKYQEAKSKGITFVFKINDLSKINLSDEDIVVLLYNLLNNAFEASEQSQEKLVYLKFLLEKESFILSVANTSNHTPIKQGDKFQTSKQFDVDMHGIGIENIKEAVEKNNGSYVIEYKEPMFRFVIVIPNKKEILW